MNILKTILVTKVHVKLAISRRKILCSLCTAGNGTASLGEKNLFFLNIFFYFSWGDNEKFLLTFQSLWARFELLFVNNILPVTLSEVTVESCYCLGHKANIFSLCSVLASDIGKTTVHLTNQQIDYITLKKLPCMWCQQLHNK